MLKSSVLKYGVTSFASAVLALAIALPIMGTEMASGAPKVIDQVQPVTASVSAATGSLNAPIMGMTADPHGGYWEVGADGGVFAFGGAPFYGSMAGQPLNGPIVGIQSTSDGGGYWLVATDGGVFAFGDAIYGGGLGAAYSGPFLNNLKTLMNLSLSNVF